MDRRDALRSVAILLGTAISAGTTEILFSSYTIPEGEKNAVIFSAAQIKTLTEIADVIIPTTKSCEQSIRQKLRTYSISRTQENANDA